MAATYDAAGYGENTSSSTSIPDFTVSLTGDNGAVAVVIFQSINSATGFNVTIGGVSASLISGTDTGTNKAYRTLIYGLATGSTSGSQTVSISWTGSCWAGASAVAATSVDQSTPFNNGTFNSGTNSTATVVVTSASGDLTFAGVASESGAQPTAPTQTQVHLDRVEFQIGVGSSRAAGAATVTHQFSADPDWVFSGVNFVQFSGSLDQEGFRWGVDDGSESAHGWEAAQDTNITIVDNQSRLLRVLVNATNDPSAIAYTLRSQKNGSGGYVAVPVGSTQTTSPPTAPSATVTTVGTAADPWTINRPAASSGDLVVFVLAWDDSTNVTSVTAPAGVNSESAVSIAGPVASASTEMRMQAWYYVATGTWSTGTLSFDPSAAETVRAVAFVIPAGQFNASDPIGWANTAASAGTAETNVNSPTGTTESNDGNGRIYIAFGSDADALTVPGSNWNTINNATGGGVGLLVGSRNTLASNSESVTALTATIAGDSWASLAFVVKPNVVNNEVYITTSANITAGGEATTARLTAPSGKTTSDFVTGRRWDDENGTDTIDITTNDYTEVEWLVALSADPVETDYFEFRVYKGGSALDTYTLTPKWTVGSGVSGAAVLPNRQPVAHLLVR